MKDKSNYVRVDKLTSIIGGQITKEYYIKDGGVISASTAPGCWGPMITPELYSGHEVTAPVYLEGAMPGDTVAIYIKKIEILSEAATSGTGKLILKGLMVILPCMPSVHTAIFIIRKLI